MNIFTLKLPAYMRFRNIINMSNGVLGISVLTMPYCFEQVSLNHKHLLKLCLEELKNIFFKCGVVLSLILLATSGFITSFSCKLLMRSARMKNIANLEFLALRTFGPVGKLLIELR